MSELNTVAIIPAKPEAAAAIAAALQQLSVATREEEGCVSYDVFESAAAPGTFVTIERWVDQAALDHHMQSPHVAAAFAAADGALSGDVAIHPLKPLT
ncbi:MAG: putative quinol monooxygenase [Ilumatobacteraceae bacterium]